MSSGFTTLQVLSSCTGLHVILGSRAGAPVPSASPELALAGVLGEFEARGERVTTVTLRLARREDATWAEPALRWLTAHGRRVILRSPAVLARSLVLRAKDCEASVVFEIAHQKLEVQRALLGAEAEAASALLLQAQYLRRLGVPVSVWLGPLLAGLHDRPGHFEPLLRHLVAADLTELHLTTGRLTPARIQALAGALDADTMTAVLRRYGVPPAARSRDAAPTSTGWRLTAQASAALVEGLRGLAERHGMRIDACGCAAHCHRDTRPRELVPVQGPGLFAAHGWQ
ncbi:MAG TPA: hypothetical protein VIK91_20620 [Nannocystis sp.]